MALSLAATVIGLQTLGTEESAWQADRRLPVVSLIPLEQVREEYIATTGEVAVQIAEDVEAAAAVAELSPAPAPPTPEEPSPAVSEAPELPLAPEAADAPLAQTPPPAPAFSPLGMPVPLTPEPTAVPSPPPPPPGGLAYGLAGELLLLINGARQQAGLPLLSRHGGLMASAEGYSQFHFLNADPYRLSHYLDGSPPERAARYGYTGLLAEVLAVGPPDAEQIFRNWMGSPEHRAILMDGQYLNIGIACYQGLAQGGGGTFETALCVGDLGT